MLYEWLLLHSGYDVIHYWTHPLGAGEGMAVYRGTCFATDLVLLFYGYWVCAGDVSLAICLSTVVPFSCSTISRAAYKWVRHCELSCVCYCSIVSISDTACVEKQYCVETGFFSSSFFTYLTLSDNRDIRLRFWKWISFQFCLCLNICISI